MYRSRDWMLPFTHSFKISAHGSIFLQYFEVRIVCRTSKRMKQMKLTPAEHSPVRRSKATKILDRLRNCGEQKVGSRNMRTSLSTRIGWKSESSNPFETGDKFHFHSRCTINFWFVSDSDYGLIDWFAKNKISVSFITVQGLITGRPCTNISSHGCRIP